MGMCTCDKTGGGGGGGGGAGGMDPIHTLPQHTFGSFVSSSRVSLLVLSRVAFSSGIGFG